MKTRIEEHVERILLNSDRKVLRLFSPRARCLILALKTLSSAPSKMEDLQAYIESYGFKCRSIDDIMKMLEFFGLAECNNECRLTETGEELAAALREYLETLRSLAYSVVEGSASEDDIVVNLVTVLASTIGFIDVYVADPSLSLLYTTIHLYITGVSALVLAHLARVSAKVYDVVKRFLEQKI